MRYKAAYRPQYVLGELACLFVYRRWQANKSLDPETYSWDPVDGDLLRRLNIRRYVSLSREKRLNIPIEPLPTNLQLNSQGPRWPWQQPGSESSALITDYIRGQGDPTNTSTSHASIFDAGTPGALTLEEVEREIALGEWGLRIQGATVQLQVR